MWNICDKREQRYMFCRVVLVTMKNVNPFAERIEKVVDKSLQKPGDYDLP